ncbi:MAG: response regulator [Hydrogenophilus sp.]|nr:response regulator [Hydrogenophilus sp.]
MAKVLIVDDEVGIREWLTEILEDEGYQVATAADGAEGSEKLRSFAPDVVLLDIWMPDIDGVALLRRWKSEEELLPPVVMISGHATIETAVEATHLGAFGYLEKPLAMQKLLEVLKKACSVHRQQQSSGVRTDLTRYPSLLQPVVEGVWRAWQQNRSALIRFPDPFFKDWLARRIDLAAQPVWFPTDSTPLTVEQLQGWKGLPVVALLPENVNKMMAKNLAFLAQHAGELKIRLVGLFVGAAFPFPNWGPYLGERLLSAWQQPLVAPGQRDAQGQLPEWLAAALAIELGHPVHWDGEAVKVIERLAAASKATFEEWVHALLPAAAEGRLDGRAVEEALLPEIEGNLSALFALPLKEAREAFERLYLERLLMRDDLPMQRLAELAGLERTHLYRKLRHLGLPLRRREEE